MKKVIMLMLFVFLFLPICKVKAINEFDLPINQNIIINKSITKYKWYKLNEISSKNEDVFEHSCEYLELKESDYSPWSKEKPEDKYGRVIESKEEYLNGEIEYIAVRLDNVLASNLRTYEIKLYDDEGNEIKYFGVVCFNCTSTYPKENLFDNNYTTYFEIKQDQPIILVLSEPTTKNVRLKIYYSNEDQLFGYRISKLDNKLRILDSKEENISTLYKLPGQNYTGYINTNKVNWSNSSSNVYYRYKDVDLICYEREYLDDYYESVDNYIKDEKQFIVDYEYLISEPEVVEKEIIKEVEIPKEIIKEIEVPKEKVVYKYINTTNTCEFEEKEKSSIEEEHSSVFETQVEEKNETKDIRRNISFLIVFGCIMSLIIVLCLILKELIKKCR